MLDPAWAFLFLRLKLQDCRETNFLSCHILPIALWTDGSCQNINTTRCYISFTFSPLVQITVGAGSPVMGTSRRSLFPATTMIVESEVRPMQSMWILGGSSKGMYMVIMGSEFYFSLLCKSISLQLYTLARHKINLHL